MGANLNGFDASQVEPQVGFEPLPAGNYLAVITESEMKSAKKSNGKYLSLTLQVLEGSYKGRNIWVNLNLEHSSADTVKFARAELSAICRAVGVMAPKDSVELHNIPLVIKVGLKKREDTGEMQNVIRGYEKKGAAGSVPAAMADATTNGNGGQAPWARQR